MKPQEFRPGNWVTINGNPVKIYGVTVDGIILNKGAGAMPFEYFKPIPITEDLLLKAGFRKVECSGGGSDYWQGQLFNLTEDLRLSTSNREYDSQDVDGSKQFEFVHEIQNIAMDLTGQELTLNL